MGRLGRLGSRVGHSISAFEWIVVVVLSGGFGCEHISAEAEAGTLDPHDLYWPTLLVPALWAVFAGRNKLNELIGRFEDRFLD